MAIGFRVDYGPAEGAPAAVAATLVSAGGRLRGWETLPGFLAGAVVELATGEVVAERRGEAAEASLDVHEVVAGYAWLLRGYRRLMADSGDEDLLEELTVTQAGRVGLLRVQPCGLALLLLLERGRANLGLALRALREA